MKVTTIILCLAEGDDAKTASTYVKKLKKFYWEHYKNEPRILIFEYETSEEALRNGIAASIHRQMFRFMARNTIEAAEIHAQGGLGAYTAYMLASQYSRQIQRVFIVGGAPASAMTGVAKLFHRRIVNLLYALHIPLFADDPNPDHDPEIAEIKALSTAFMHRFPELYKMQLNFLATWELPEGWRFSMPAYFIPNGKTAPLKTWWDNSYNNQRAAEIWRKHGAKILPRPSRGFSFYSMMPAEALLEIMAMVSVDSNTEAQ